jgi:hypothetical protein
MPILTAVLVLLALVGFAALGLVVARWLAWAEELAEEPPPPPPPPKQTPDLYDRLLRALIEGPEDREFVEIRRRWNKGSVQSAVDEMRANPLDEREDRK